MSGNKLEVWSLKTITVGYSKVKTGLVLFTLAFIAVCPLLMYLALPQVFATSGKSFGYIAVVYGVFALTTLLSTAALMIKLYKLKSSKEAFIIYRDGIWSNVSGIREKFIPWGDVDRAYKALPQDGSMALWIAQKETEQEYLSRSKLSRRLRPILTTPVVPITLEKCAIDLAETINAYVAEYNKSCCKQKPVVDTLDEYVRRAA